MKNKLITFPEDIIFVSSRIAGWGKIFYPSSFDLNKIKRLKDWGNPYAKEIFLSLKWFRDKKLIKLYNYCLMPNHLHFICKMAGKYNLNKFLKEFHKYTAHRILDLAEKLESWELLNHFVKRNNKNDRKHLIWESCIGKVLEKEANIWRAIDYIDYNPVAKGWNLVENFTDYPYSSACFYYKGEKPLIEIDNIFEEEG
jgi:REP element-mobilizing transposase RayT